MLEHILTDLTPFPVNYNPQSSVILRVYLAETLGKMVASGKVCNDKFTSVNH